MDLENVRLLLEVIERGSVHGAARQLRVSRSMLRRRLEALEAETGCELFVANASGVVLTPSGAVIADEGRALLEQSARMLATAKAAQQPSAALRIVVPIGMPDVVRVELLQALRATSPGVRVHERERADPLSHLHEPFELMFHFGAPPSYGTWFSRVLHRVRLVPLASQAYRDARGRPSSVDALREHLLLSWRRPGADPLAWPRLAGGSMPVEPVFVSDNPQLLHRAAQRGLGILLGSPAPFSYAEPTPLFPVLEDAIADEAAIRLLSPLPVNVDPRMRAVVQGVLDFLDSNAVLEHRSA